MVMRAPGVSFREIEVAPAPRLDLTVAGFVGLAETGPVGSPRVLTEWGRFRDLFGGFTGHAYLPYAVYAFFANGGERCHVVRVGDDAVTAGAFADGLAALGTVREVGTVAAPDLILPDLVRAVPVEDVPEAGIVFARPPRGSLEPETLRLGQTEMLRHCQALGDRFALLDSPPGARLGVELGGDLPIEGWQAALRPRREASFGALYYPWVEQRPDDFEGRALLVPPCGHLAGIYARSERQRGVGKAPANEILRGVVDLEVCLDDDQQALLNPVGVNCLRLLPGRGLRVWGARTLSSDTRWRYVNVRRVALAVVKQILVELRWTVFEPNDRGLWDRIVAELGLFLRRLFVAGALAGETAEEAFYVKCDEETNPPEVVERGEVLVEVGFAPARPAEFVVVTIRRTTESLSVGEPGA
jgi:hypothetical protein